MSFKAYRILDLTIFTILYFAFEYLVQKAAIDWFPEQAFSVSLLLMMLLLIMMRWDYLAIPLLPIFGAYFVYITSRPGTLPQYATYIIGNLGLIISIVLLKKIGKDKIRKSVPYTILYVIGSYILLEAFRSIGAMIFSNVGIGIFIQYLFIDILNLAFSLIVILIARKVNGLFEDQKSYLIKLSKERENSSS